jgi:hypothetical protein
MAAWHPKYPYSLMIRRYEYTSIILYIYLSWVNESSKCALLVEIAPRGGRIIFPHAQKPKGHLLYPRQRYGNQIYGVMIGHDGPCDGGPCCIVLVPPASAWVVLEGGMTPRQGPLAHHAARTHLRESATQDRQRKLYRVGQNCGPTLGLE